MNHLGHNFILYKQSVINYNSLNRYKCENCNIIIVVGTDNKIRVISNYLSGYKVYTLTCEEQIIKNIIE